MAYLLIPLSVGDGIWVKISHLLSLEAMRQVTKSRVDVKDTRIVEFRVSLLSSPSFFSFFFRPSSPFLLFENYPSRGKHEPAKAGLLFWRCIVT